MSSTTTTTPTVPGSQGDQAFLSSKAVPMFSTHTLDLLSPPVPQPANQEGRGSGTYSMETLTMVVRPKWLFQSGREESG